jgi:hypothetical protein
VRLTVAGFKEQAMGITIWSVVFTLQTVQDTPEDVSESLNGLIGADLQRQAKPLLAAAGWNFADAWPEDHGWASDAPVIDEGKTIGVSFVTSPELDQEASDGRALNDRWRIVVGLDTGMFAKTKTRRFELLRAMARDAENVCLSLGASGLVWEVGGPQTADLAKAL